jgi:hypothetical protein
MCFQAMSRATANSVPMIFSMISRNRYVEWIIGTHATDADKKKDTWATTHDILASPQAAEEAKLFAVTTLKGKVGAPSVHPASLTHGVDHV